MSFYIEAGPRSFSFFFLQILVCFSLIFAVNGWDESVRSVLRNWNASEEHKLNSSSNSVPDTITQIPHNMTAGKNADVTLCGRQWVPHSSQKKASPGGSYATDSQVPSEQVFSSHTVKLYRFCGGRVPRPMKRQLFLFNQEKWYEITGIQKKQKVILMTAGYLWGGAGNFKTMQAITREN